MDTLSFLPTRLVPVTFGFFFTFAASPLATFADGAVTLTPLARPGALAVIRTDNRLPRSAALSTYDAPVAPTTG